MKAAPPPLTPELAKNAMILLARVDIKGNEAPLFMRVMAALQGIVDEPADDAVADLREPANGR